MGIDGSRRDVGAAFKGFFDSGLQVTHDDLLVEIL
jgi:hypothetical protein